MLKSIRSLENKKEQAFEQIARLIDRFHEHIDEYKKGSYNEHQTRIDYIDPFFKALGWDMDNRQGYAEAYREVLHEDKLKIGRSTKAPDYCFTVYGQRKFFVDAKKPSINIKSDIAPAFQVRRYGWSAKLPISVVTDFEEFSVYDCTKKPNLTDKASHARISYLTYDKYLDNFDFLWDTFSKEGLLKGRFDKFVKSDTKKKGTATVDDEFLKSIEDWRTYLATTIALRNKQLNEAEINYAVQKVIDRIIFLRMCEDRGVEPYGELKKAISKGEVFKNLNELFYQADAKYNSGLFDFKEDIITPLLEIDNKVLKNIIKELYYPESPYEFSVLPVDILGSVYERFLGKTIRLTPAHHAKIEDKPEVRKAGGVYYTPKYIVDYIVESTVGELVQGKKPKDVQSLRFCDPACGSGSFLIGTYQYLLDWHLEFYMPDFKRLSDIASSTDYNRKERDKAIKDRAKFPLTPEGNLTTSVKKQILLNNIYGVDIDSQAVEVTKLNLLLKAMEGETNSSITSEMTFGKRVLPNLSKNIKCGNSLIGTDFYDDQPELFPSIKKINAFDWDEAFPEVFSGGGLPAGASAKAGFDAVIGNPPYVRQELLTDQKDYFLNNYKVYHGMADLYTYFFEKGINLLNKKGMFGIIVANKWMRARYGEPLRKWLKEQNIKKIIDFGDLPVFQNATTYPCIFISGKTNEKSGKFYSTEMADLHFNNLNIYVEANQKEISKANLESSGWQLVGDNEVRLLNKLKEKAIPLGEYVNGKIHYGIKTGLNEAFVIDEETKNCLIAEDPKSEEVIKPFLAGRDIKRYQPPGSDKYLIFTKRGINIDLYPAIKNHLSQFKERLTPKPKDWNGEKWKGRKPGPYKWYEIQDTVAYWKEFEKPKIMLPDIAIRPQVIFDNSGFYCVNTAYIIPVDDKLLLAILNSKLINFFYSKITSSIRGGYMRFIRQYLEQIPIPNNISNQKSDKIIQKVETLLSLNQQISEIRIDTERTQIQRAFNHTEKEVDKLVYELYGLGEEEIMIVEA